MSCLVLHSYVVFNAILISKGFKITFVVVVLVVVQSEQALAWRFAASTVAVAGDVAIPCTARTGAACANGRGPLLPSSIAIAVVAAITVQTSQALVAAVRRNCC